MGIRFWSRLTVVVATLFIPYTAFGQQIDDIWEMRSKVNVDGLLLDWDAATSTCGVTTLKNHYLGGAAEVLIYKIIPGTTGVDSRPSYAVILRSNNRTNDQTTYASIQKFYCLRESSLKDHFSPKEPLFSGGIISVPFKLRFNPLKIMAGGALGGFAGHKFHHSKDIASTLLLFASLTNIPLNDTNDSVPQTQWGLGTGLGWVLTIPDNFQVGVVAGWDWFSWPDNWPYKWTPWLSISIGYSFVSPQKQSAVQAAQSIQ